MVVITWHRMRHYSVTDLKFGMTGRRELIRFKNVIEFTEVASMHRGDSLGLEHAFVLMQVLTGRQRAEEARQTVDLSGALQHLADTRHLLLSEAERCRDVTAVGDSVRC